MTERRDDTADDPLTRAAARVLSEDEDALNRIIAHLLQSSVISPLELKRALCRVAGPESRATPPAGSQLPDAR